MTIAKSPSPMGEGTSTLKLYTFKLSHFYGVQYVSYMDQGKSRMKSTGTSNKKLAEKSRLEIEENQQRRKNGLEPVLKIESILLCDFIDIYLEDRKRLEKAHRTITTDEYALKRLMTYTGDVALNTIDDNLIRKYRDHKLQQIKPTSLAIELRTLKAAFSWAVGKPGKKYLRRNPFKQKDLTPATKNRKIPLCFSPEEKKHFFCRDRQ
ncbi:phage integrase SAM-like domain-containing protein [bacterium]|nr:phage integrase SAM-like domain-containing protein [bacterium]